MSAFYTSDELIKAIKRRAMVPDQQSTFTDEDFLAFADEEMNLGMVPSVLSMREDYFLRTERIPLVTGTSRYVIPYRAIGNKLREISFEDSQGNIFEMTRIGVGDVPFYQGTIGSPTNVYLYYIESNEICLVPSDLSLPSGTNLVVSFYLRPNSLVLTKEVAAITAIDRTTGIIQVSNVPEKFSQAMLYDFVQMRSPHKILNYDQSIISVNPISKTITFNPETIPSQLLIGDHICLAEQSAIPQIPSDLHVVLSHRVATRCLEALGDSEGLKNANQKLLEFEQKTMAVIDNRVEDSPRKVFNRRSILSQGLNARRRYRGF